MAAIKIKTFICCWLIGLVLVLTFVGCSARKPVAVPAHPEEIPLPEVSPPGNAFYFFAESQIQRKKGDLDKAAEFLQKAIALDPESMLLERELVQLYWQQKKDAEANERVDDLISRFPEDIENLIVYAKIKHSLKYLDEATTAYEKVIAKDPKRKDIYLLLGGLYTDQGNSKFAIQVYDKLIKEFPGFFAGYYLMGQLNALVGDFEKAEKTVSPFSVSEKDNR